MTKTKTANLAWHNFSGCVDPEIDPGPILDFLGKDPVTTLAQSPDAKLVRINKGKGTNVYRCNIDSGHGLEEFFIKTLDGRQIYDELVTRFSSQKNIENMYHYYEKIIKLIFMKSVAENSWNVELACQKKGLSTADTMFFLTRKKGFFLEEVIVTKGVNPRKGNAKEYFLEKLDKPDTKEIKELKNDLIKKFGHLTRKVKESEIMLLDFALYNLIIREKEDGELELVIIDLTEAQVNRPDYPEFVFLDRTTKRMATFTEDDKILFIKAYLEAGNDNRTPQDILDGIKTRKSQKESTSKIKRNYKDLIKFSKSILNKKN
jgi:hypothetical protein